MSKSNLYAVISDIHGNYAALLAVARDARSVARAEDLPSPIFLCLGDVVDYGPQPNECMYWLARNKPLFVVRGNHDVEAAQPYLRKPTRVGEAWWPITLWTRLTLKPQYRERLGAWPAIASCPNHGMGLEPFLFFHSDPHERDAILDSAIKARGVFEELQRRDYQYALFGHSHFQMLYTRRGRGRNNHIQAIYAAPEDYRINSSQESYLWPVNQWHYLPATATLLNPGSVGQPRFHSMQPGGDARASYLLLHQDPAEGFRFQWRRVRYDVGATVRLLCSLAMPTPQRTASTGKDIRREPSEHDRAKRLAAFRLDVEKMERDLPGVARRLANALLQRGDVACP